MGRRPGGGGDGEAPADLQLEIVLLELLSKGRLLYCLYEDEVEGGGPRSSARNSVLPLQPDDPSACPYPRKPELAAGDLASHSAVLLLLAPVLPEEIRETYPQLVLLNGEGIGGPFRDVVAAPLAARWAMSALGHSGGTATPPPAVPRWVAVPALYAEGLALAVLGALGGPDRVAIRPPVALDGGGEVVATAELDAVLRAIIEPPADGEMYGADEMEKPAAPNHAGGADAAAKRARARARRAGALLGRGRQRGGGAPRRRGGG